MIIKIFLLTFLLLISNKQTFAFKIESGIIVTASNQYDINSKPENVLDGNLQTIWNSGKGAPQWIRLDLGSTYPISKLHFVITQSPNGVSNHTITAGPSPDSQVKIGQIYRHINNGESINLAFPKIIPNIRYITITTTSSPSWVGWSEINVYSDTLPETQHLKYFGYYNVDGLPPGSANYIPEIDNLKNSNISHIIVGDESVKNDDVKVPEMLSSMHQHQTKAIINVGAIFFAGNQLYPNWIDRWNKFKNQIKNYESDIYAFYFDEPLMVGLPKDQFLTVTATIRQDYPNIATMAVEAYFSGNRGVDIDSTYFANITDFGFDLYLNRYDTSWETYSDYFKNFNQKFKDKNFWIIPDGIAKNTAQLNNMETLLNNYYWTALSTDNVVGMLNFLYPSLKAREPEWQFSLRDILLPQSANYNSKLSTLHQTIGKSIINRPVTTIPGNFNNDTVVDLLDFSFWKTEYLNNNMTLIEFNVWKTAYLAL